MYRRDKTTISVTVESHGLEDQHHHLEKENEEKNHKVEAGIGAERFVCRSVPGDGGK